MQAPPGLRLSSQARAVPCHLCIYNQVLALRAFYMHRAWPLTRPRPRPMVGEVPEKNLVGFFSPSVLALEG